MIDSYVRIQSRDEATRQLDDRYDLLVGVVGFEQRSMFIPEQMGSRCTRVLIPEFDVNQQLGFERNAARADELGFEHPRATDTEFEQLIRGAASELRQTLRVSYQPRVLVDVSSMTRVRMALTLAALRQELPIPAVVDVAYAPAIYTDALEEDGPVSESQPLPHFAGWSLSPTIELGMILGLGFESHLALGVVETHEPADIWCFVPSGIDRRYDQRVAKVNRLLLESVRPERILTYDVLRPFATAEAIQGILRVTAMTHRMMVVPLGAKAFCVSTLAVALAFENRLNVWRVSAGRHGVPVDRIANGDVCIVRLRLSEGVDSTAGPGPGPGPGQLLLAPTHR